MTQRYWVIKQKNKLETNGFNTLTLYTTKKQAIHHLNTSFPKSLIKLAKLEVVEVHISLIS